MNSHLIRRTPKGCHIIDRNRQKRSVSSTKGLRSRKHYTNLLLQGDWSLRSLAWQLTLCLCLLLMISKASASSSTIVMGLGYHSNTQQIGAPCYTPLRHLILIPPCKESKVNIASVCWAGCPNHPLVWICSDKEMRPHIASIGTNPP